MQKHPAFSQTMRAEPNFGIKRDSEISAYVVNKDHLTSRHDHAKHLLEVRTLRHSMDNDFTNATTIAMETGRKSLYTTIISNNKAIDSIIKSRKISPACSPRGYSDRSMSPLTKEEKWDKNGEVSSINHLIKDTLSQRTEDRIDMASEIYIPGNIRVLKYDNRPKKVRQLQPLAPEEILKLQL